MKRTPFCICCKCRVSKINNNQLLSEQIFYVELSCVHGDNTTSVNSLSDGANCTLYLLIK